MLRRALLTAAGFIVVGSMTLTGTIATAEQPETKVAPGSTWSLTFGSGSGPCETQFFAHGTWAADKNGDAGTYVVQVGKRKFARVTLS